MNSKDTGGDEGNFSAKTMSIRAQKKILGKVSSRNLVKHFINDTAARLLDKLYKILKDFYSKKEAEKVVKNVIKVSIKLGALLRQDQFSDTDRRRLGEFQRKFRSLLLTIKLLAETRQALFPVVDAHLSEKSHRRVEMVFDYLGKETFCDSLFKIGGAYEQAMADAIDDLDQLLENSEL